MSFYIDGTDMPVKFKRAVFRSGNSYRITLPMPIVKTLEIEEKDIMEIWMNNSHIIVQKSGMSGKISRNERKEEILDYLAKPTSEMGPGVPGIEKMELITHFSKIWDCRHREVDELINELINSKDILIKNSKVHHKQYGDNWG